VRPEKITKKKNRITMKKYIIIYMLEIKCMNSDKPNEIVSIIL